MTDKLSRQLGFFSVIAIACGAMLAGLLVLPAYAIQFTGPSVFFAFLLAGLLFIPATLSKSEMATAIPEAGGDYLFVDRSMGPFFSTISGIGMYLTFTLKTAFALSGMSAYLLTVFHFNPRFTGIIAVAVAGGLTYVNYRGVKKSGNLQNVLFFVVVFFLLYFMGKGSVEVSKDNFWPFLSKGWSGFFTATAFVFVSYAGVTKLASVAEEIKNPGQTIPAGMLVSLGAMILLYVGVVYVFVGIIPTDELMVKEYRNAPMALFGLKAGGPYGKVTIAIVSVVALIAMANAGLLASSRYPLALSRNKQLPSLFNRIHPEYSTPSVSVLATGILLIVLILYFPVVQLAKMASAFKLIVLGFLNAALIVFRESDIEWYRPSFRAPFYPYVQILGILASCLLIPFLGLVPLLASAGLILAGAGWYFAYARSRTARQGAIQRNVIAEESATILNRYRDRDRINTGTVLVPVFELQPNELSFVERRIRLGAGLCAEDGVLEVLHFCEVPDQSFLKTFNPDKQGINELSERVNLLRGHFDTKIVFDQVITHRARAALREYVRDSLPEWLLYKWTTPSPWQFLLGKRRWWMEDFPCNLAFFDDHGQTTFKDVLVLTEPGLYDGEVVRAADRIARHYEGLVTFFNPVAPTEQAREFVSRYQTELKRMCRSRTHSEAIPVDDWLNDVLERTAGADLLVMGGLTSNTFPEFSGKEYGEMIAKQADCSVMRVRSQLRHSTSVMRDHAQSTEETEALLASGPLRVMEGTRNKEALFETLSEMMSDADVARETIEEALWRREKSQETYLEQGVAFPHGIVEQLEETRCGILQLEEPVTYTDNGDEADLFVVLLGPSSDRKRYLELIRSISRLMRDHGPAEFVERLQESP